MPRRSKNSASLWKCDEFWRRALASPRSSTHNVGFLCSNRFSMRMKLHREFPFLTGFLNGIGVIDQMHFCVRALDEHITLARLFIFSVEKDAASHTLQLAEGRDFERESLGPGFLFAE